MVQSRTATLLSHRAGGTGTVTAEARNWTAALSELGFSVRRVAGDFLDEPATDDVRIDGLCAPAQLCSARELRGALDGSDLVIVDNMCSTDRHPEIAAVAAEALQLLTMSTGAKLLLRHHDLPWHRAGATNNLPPRLLGAVHAPLNLRSRRELQARGYESVVMVQKYFDFDLLSSLPGGEPASQSCSDHSARRAATRAALGYTDADIVLWQPTKADERNNFAGTVRYLQALTQIVPAHRVKCWISGPVAAPYQTMFDKLNEHAPVQVNVQRVEAAADAYAACDAVLFPAARDRFGTILLESIAARKPCVISGFAALGELEACGLKYFPTDAPGELVKFLAKPSERFLDTNERRARISFSIDQLPAAINVALRPLGLDVS